MPTLPDRVEIEEFLTKKLKEEYQNFADIRITFGDYAVDYDCPDILTYKIQYREYTKSGRISNWKTLYL